LVDAKVPQDAADRQICRNGHEKGTIKFPDSNSSASSAQHQTCKTKRKVKFVNSIGSNVTFHFVFVASTYQGEKGERDFG
jgi:hypothetical protein